MIAAAKLLKWFGILSDVQIDELLNSSPPNPVIGTGNIDHHMPWADFLENKLDYKFNNRAFLLQVILIYQKHMNLNYII